MINTSMIEETKQMATDSIRKYPDAIRIMELRSECVERMTREVGYQGHAILAEAWGCHVRLVKDGPWIRLITIEPTKKHGCSI